MHIQKTFIITLLSLLMGSTVLNAIEAETAPEQTISSTAEKNSDPLLELIPFVADCDFGGFKNTYEKLNDSDLSVEVRRTLLDDLEVYAQQIRTEKLHQYAQRAHKRIKGLCLWPLTKAAMQGFAVLFLCDFIIYPCPNHQQLPPETIFPENITMGLIAAGFTYCAITNVYEAFTLSTKLKKELTEINNIIAFIHTAQSAQTSLAQGITVE
jgi:hypothetical protein